MNQDHKENTTKIMNLLAKAAFSQLTHEKNMIIRDVQSCFLEIDSKFQEKRTSNAYKTEELEHYKKNYSEMSALLEDARNKKGIIDRVNKRSTNSLNDDFRRKIAALDDEIIHLNEEYIRYESSGNEITLSLIDTYMKKLEDYAYELKKRNIVVNQGNEVTDQINEDFGSIPNLVNEYYSLKKENQRLISEELEAANNPIIKRRKMSSICNVAARSLSEFLQSDLNCQMQCKERLTKTQEFSSKTRKNEIVETPEQENMLDFSKLSNDSGFNDFFEGKESADLEEHLKELQKKIKEKENDYEHLLQSNENSARSASARTTSSGKMDKMESMCQNLMQICAGHRSTIEESTKEVEKLSVELLERQKERNYYELTYSKLFLPIEQLLKQHEETRKYLDAYNEIAKTLFSVSSFFALEMEKEGESVLHSLEKYSMPASIEQYASFYKPNKKEEKEDQKSTRKPTIAKVLSSKKLIKPVKSSTAVYIKPKLKEHKLIIPMKKNKMSLKDINFHNAYDESIEENDDTLKTMAEVVKNENIFTPTMRANTSYNKIVNFFMISNLVHVGGFLYNNKYDPLSLIRTFRKEQLEGIESIAREQLEALGKMRNSCISQLRQLTNFILVKEKSNVSVQTDKLPLIDAEVMVDIQKKKK